MARGAMGQLVRRMEPQMTDQEITDELRYRIEERLGVLEVVVLRNYRTRNLTGLDRATIEGRDDPDRVRLRVVARYKRPPRHLGAPSSG